MTNVEAGKVMEQFFKKEIPAEEFAKHIRIHLHEMLLLYFLSDEGYDIGKKTMHDGYFWLMLLAERLDPVMGIYEEPTATEDVQN